MRNVLIVAFVAGIAGTIYFWVSDRNSLTFFLSFLQFVAVFALIWLTFLYVAATHEYVKATHDQVADQNRPPKIAITYHYEPSIDPFVISFDVQAANPSIRATSLAVTSLRIGEFSARELYFEVNQTRMRRITIPARDLMNVLVKATNFNPPGIPIALGFKTPCVVNFEDVFHGSLSVTVEV